MFPFSYSGQKHTDLIPTTVHWWLYTLKLVTGVLLYVQKLEWQKVTRPWISNKKQNHLDSWKMNQNPPNTQTNIITSSRN